ncbi:hypothetical protein [Desulfovibrio sp. JC022]|uniref:hypothetical protein n=1 Tax=Desulfovibrio sp. JC022 TaxID=2593642 RepID=UPI0013D7AFFD|nr:hypothetical protein [Desulfovibrio sp. JC022]NDV24782.1 hypothetical protein [Desulfovibrio sp. JC022]
MNRFVICFLVFLFSFPFGASAAENPNYVQFPDFDLIEHDLSELPDVYSENYHKFIRYKTATGPILIVAHERISDEQLLRAYNILDFYLTDVSGIRYGTNKECIAEHMAEQGAVLVMPDGADGDSDISDDALEGQPLYELEFPTEGSVSYITNDYGFRDAGFEEIFHLVHDYGIGTRETSGILRRFYQSEITVAMQNSLKQNIWGRAGVDDWLEELREEGSLEQEYIVSVIDSYYGFWGAWNETDGGMWGIYAAKTRDDVKQLDLQGYAVLQKFFPPMISYMARIDPEFSGVFDMQFDPSKPYTHKSQYLLNARLLGHLPSGIVANGHDNILIGNSGSNMIDGRGGQDVVQYPGPAAVYKVYKKNDRVFVTEKSRPENADELINIEVLRFTDVDLVTSDL